LHFLSDACCDGSVDDVPGFSAHVGSAPAIQCHNDKVRGHAFVPLRTQYNRFLVLAVIALVAYVAIGPALLLYLLRSNLRKVRTCESSNSPTFCAD
jgi:hypothetical protein